MSEMTAVLGAEFTFTFEGKSYKVGPRTFGVERAMVVFAEQRDYEKIRQHTQMLGGGMTRDQVSDWRKTCTAGHWEYGSQGFSELFSTPLGIRKAFYLQMKEHNPEFSEDVIDRVWKDPAKLSELDDLIDAANADPTTAGRPTPTPTQN